MKQICTKPMEIISRETKYLEVSIEISGKIESLFFMLFSGVNFVYANGDLVHTSY